MSKNKKINPVRSIKFKKKKNKTSNRVKIGIVGCGAIGRDVAVFIDKNLKKAASLAGLADLDKKKAKALQKKLSTKANIYDADSLVKKSDLVIEAASVEAAKLILEKALLYKKDVFILSVGAFIGEADIFKKAQEKGIKIYVPSGAICGIDGLGALRLGNIRKISLTTSKPPRGLKGADFLKKKKINLENLIEETVIFKGGVKEAIRYFPKNINVAATLLLASNSKDVGVCIKTDPKLKRNTHVIEVMADEAKIKISVENVPSKSNPKTSALAILSTKALLERIFSPFKIGS